MKLLVPLSFSALAVATACGPATYTATMNGASEVPAVTTSATGSATATLNDTTLTISGSYSGLSSPAVTSHIHGPVAASSPGGPAVCDLTVTESTPGTGTIEAVCPSFDVARLNEELFYVNVHSANHLAGEIRGQLRKK